MPSSCLNVTAILVSAAPHSHFLFDCMYVYVSICTVRGVSDFICCFTCMLCDFMVFCINVQHQSAKGLQMETSQWLQAGIFTCECTLICTVLFFNKKVNKYIFVEHVAYLHIQQTLLCLMVQYSLFL